MKRTRHPIWTIAKLTLREAARRKILLAAVGLGLVFLLIYGAGVYFIYHDMGRTNSLNNELIVTQMFNFLMLCGMYVVNFLFAVMTVLTSVDTIAGEITTGTIQSLAAKPVKRWHIYMGKWLGYVIMLTAYLLLMAGGVLILVRLTAGYVTPNPLQGIGLILLNGILLLNVSFLGGTRLSTVTNGVFVLTMYGIAFVGGWIEQVGSFLGSQAAVNIGILSSLIFPSEALWKRAAYEMRSLLVDAVGFSPFTSSSSLPNAIMVVYAVAYAIIVLVVGIHSFNKRDL